MEDNKELTKKENAELAGKDVAEVAARGAGRYYGGSLGGAAVDAALKTKAGQKVVGHAGKQLNKNIITRNLFANNQRRISHGKTGIMSMFGGSSSTSDNYQDIEDTVNDSTIVGTDNIKGSGKVNGLWKKLPIKTKLTLLGIGTSFCFVIIFLVILITPLMELGIIDISDIGSSMGGSTGGGGYVSVPGSIYYWWPVNSSKSRITSPYGYRSDPQTGEKKYHNGVDIATGDGPGVVDILASNSGTVTKVVTGCPTTVSIHDSNTSDDQCGGRYGNYIMITHGDQNVTVYAHLYSVNVSLNDRVSKGQVIGKMGSSGRSTGTHLHFEVRVNGERINPTDYVSITNTKP